MKSGTLFLLATLLFACTVTADTYQSKQHGFTIDVATDKSQSNNQLAMFFLAPSAGFAPNVNIQTQPYKQSFESYIELSEGQFAAMNLTVINKEMKEKEAILEYKGIMQGNMLHWYGRVIQKESTIYLITGTCLESQWPKVKERIIASVESFSF